MSSKKQEQGLQARSCIFTSSEYNVAGIPLALKSLWPLMDLCWARPNNPNASARSAWAVAKCAIETASSCMDAPAWKGGGLQDDELPLCLTRATSHSRPSKWGFLAFFINPDSWIVCLVLGLILSTSQVQAEEPRATPYRPTVSNPAQLPVPGYLEVEVGWQTLKDKVTDAHRHSVPARLKLAFTDRVGMLISGEMVVINDQESGATVGGVGDLTPQLKFHFPMPTETTSALGLELGAKLPTAPRTIGSQQTDWILTGIYSLSHGPLGIDLNLGYTRLGGTPSGKGKDQVSWAASTAYALTSRWNVGGEIAGTARQAVKPFSQILAFTNWAVTQQIVVDTGLAFGINGVSQEWTAFAGMTVLLGKVL